MKKVLLSLILILSTGTLLAQTTITKTWSSPSSVSINNVGSAYGYDLPPVTFNASDFPQTSGCVISDVDVVINWAKTAGTCSSPTGGCSFHGDTHFRIDGPASDQVLAQPGTWSGCTSISSVTTTFSQGSPIPSGTPTTGTFGPNGGNLNAYNGTSAFGSWNLEVGNDWPEPVCLTYYQVKITTSDDNTAPSISGPGDVSYPATNGQCGRVVTYSTPTASDFCGLTGPPTISNGLLSGSTFPVGTTLVQWSVEDNFGNVATHSFNVIITDTQDPSISCPADATVSANGSCVAPVSFNTPSASDNCAIASVNQSGGPSSGSNFGLGSTQISFTATDVNGNTETCSFNVIVEDNTAPSITCPTNVTVNADPGACSAAGISIGSPSTSDNCSVSSVTDNGLSTYPVGTTNVVWTVTDGAGNTNSCTQTVTVNDNQNPTISCPSDITINNDPGQCGAIVNYSTPSGSDNCSATTSMTSGLASGSLFPIATTTVTYTATDPTGNQGSCSFNVTVTDNENPVMSCPANVTEIAPTGTCAANVTFNTPTASDNCPGVSVSQDQGPSSGSSFPVGVETIGFEATDVHGNSISCSFTVTVVDVEDPEITCPADISVLSTTGNCGAPVTYSAPTATDNCSGVSTALSGGLASGSIFPQGTTAVEWTATDASGNTSSCSFVVTVDPVPNGTLSVAPSPICQGDQTVITFTFTSGTPPFNVTFTDGVSTFNANGLQSGDTYTITPPTTVTYSYLAIQDATGCARTSGFDGTAQVVVTPLPTVSFTGLDAVYCESDPDVTLTGNQSGGVFFGTGVINLGGGQGTFSPSSAGPTGPYDVTYTYTDINNCTDSEEQQVYVDEQPVADAGSGGDECDLDFTFSAVPSVGTGTWTTVSGPALPFFSDVNSPTSVVQVAATGTYVFQWTEANGECSDSDQITVNFWEVPNADAGFGGSECDLDFDLGANPSVGVGTWTSSGPGTATFSPNANDPNATVTVDSYGTYTFTWTEDNNGCTDAANVVVVFDQQTQANAGTGGDECDLNFTFSAVPSVGVGAWTASGPGLASFNAVNSPTATVTVSNYGTYTFTWTETNGNCVAVDQVTVNFYEQPIADAGSGGNECDLDFQFSAVPSVGNGQWTQLNGPGSSSFIDDLDPTTSVTVDQYGTYTYRWTETNGTCSDNATVVVNYYEQPTADAGTGGDECDLNFTFNGTASVGVGLWTASGPGTATFVNDIDVNTTVTVSAYGTYTFTWTELNGTCSSTDFVVVNFYEQPVAVAGPGGNECDLDFLLQASPSVGTGMWSFGSGPGNASFSNPSSPTTLVTVDVYGTYEFTWTETNGSCVDSRNAIVNFYEQPVADAGSGGDECDLDFTLSAVASVGSGQWMASGPGNATFADDTDANTVVTVDQAGAYTFTWTETNGVCTDSDDVVVNLYEQPAANAGSGGNECDLNFTFNGVASFGTGTWTYTGPGNAFFNNANNATTTVVVDAYGSYDFTWTEVNGVCSDDATITVNFYEQPVADAGIGGSECDLDFNLIATPSVGNGTWTYTGPGNATFAPSANDAAATVTVDQTGTYMFTWTEDNNGCTDSQDVTVDFNPLPVVSFSGLTATYCTDQTTPVPLTGTPSGGTFSGDGIAGNSFVPSLAPVGNVDITYTYTDGNGCTNSETQTIEVIDLPVVSYTGLDAAYCEDDANAYTLTGSPTGGTFSGPGISGDDFTPSSAGSGTHTIVYEFTNQYGCVNTSEQQVTVNELPVVSFSGLNVSYCEDAAIATLIGSPAGGTFSGDGINGSSFDPSSAGLGIHTVTYTYTDGNGCTNSASQDVTIDQLPAPVITPNGTQEICDGESLTLDAGPGYASYNWSNNTNGQTNIVTQAGAYNVIVTTAQGCSATSAAVQVIVNQPPMVDLGNDTTICSGSSIQLDAGNSGADYYWSTTEISQQITVSNTNAYSVDVTDGNGCVGSDVVVVTVTDLLNPTIVADGPLTFCAGGSVGLDAGAGYADYQWSTGDITQDITVSTSGVVGVQVWDQFGCSGTDEVVVDVLQLPNAVITASGSVSICEGDTVTLSATNNFSEYYWNPTGDTTSFIEVTEAGTYSVEVTDPVNNCVAISNEIAVTVNTVDPPYIVASGPTEFCDGQSVSLSVEPGPYNSYLWSSGSTTPSIVVTETGDYGVTVIDANGCTDSTLLGNPQHVEVWDPQPIAEQQGDSVVVTNGPFQQYQWYYNGAPIPGATQSVHYPTASGNYVVEVWDENGCTGESYNIEFTFTGIADLSEQYDINIYPNPNDGRFTLEVDFGKSVDATLSVKDVVGKDIMSPEQVQSVSSVRRTFDIGHLSKGVYYVEITTTSGHVVKPVIRN